MPRRDDRAAHLGHLAMSRPSSTIILSGASHRRSLAAVAIDCLPCPCIRAHDRVASADELEVKQGGHTDRAHRETRMTHTAKGAIWPCLPAYWPARGGAVDRAWSRTPFRCLVGVCRQLDTGFSRQLVIVAPMGQQRHAAGNVLSLLEPSLDTHLSYNPREC